MKDILLSICIPTYNRYKYLDRCLKSVLCYEDNDIEILVQDNNSEDKTESIVMKYLNDKRLIYEKNLSNIGAVKNVWKLIQKANGKYIFFLTDDDFLLPDSIQKLIEYINLSNPICFKTELIMLLENSKESSYYKLQKNSKEDLFLFSHILTGLCFEKKLFFKKYNGNFDGNLYPSIGIMGILLNEASYFEELIAIHTWENETFWPSGKEPGSLGIKKELIDLILFLESYIDDEIYKKILNLYCIRNRNIPIDFKKYFSLNEIIKLNLNIMFDVFKSIIKRCGREILC